MEICSRYFTAEKRFRKSCGASEVVPPIIYVPKKIYYRSICIIWCEICPTTIIWCEICPTTITWCEICHTTITWAHVCNHSGTPGKHETLKKCCCNVGRWPNTTATFYQCIMFAGIGLYSEKNILRHVVKHLHV